MKSHKIMVSVSVVSMVVILLVSFAALPGSCQKRVTMWSCWTEFARQEAVGKAGEELEKQNPGVKLQVDTVSWDMIPKKWPAGLASGTLPDLITTWAEGALAMWVAGAIEPADDLVEDLGGEAVYHPVAKKMWFYDGHWLSVPVEHHCHTMVYRKDRLDAAGLDIPVSWAEYLDAVKKMSNPPEYYGAVQFFDKRSQWATYTVQMWTWLNGGHLVDENFDVTLNTPENIETVKFLFEVYKAASPPGAMDYGTVDTYKLWMSGFNSSIMQSAGILDTAKETAPDVFEGTTFLLPPLNTRYVMPRFQDYSEGLVITSQSKEPELAAKFIKIFMVPQNIVNYLGAYATTFRSLYKPWHPAIVKWNTVDNPFLKDKPEAFQTIAEIYNTANAIPAFYDYGPNPYGHVFMNGTIEEMFHRIILENIPVEQAVKDTEAELQRMVDEAKARAKK